MHLHLMASNEKRSYIGFKALFLLLWLGGREIIQKAICRGLQYWKDVIKHWDWPVSCQFVIHSRCYKYSLSGAVSADCCGRQLKYNFNWIGNNKVIITLGEINSWCFDKVINMSRIFDLRFRKNHHNPLSSNAECWWFTRRHLNQSRSGLFCGIYS